MYEPVIKDPHAAVFPGHTDCRKSHLVWDLVERASILTTVSLSDQHSTKMKHAIRVESDMMKMDKLYQWIEKLSLLLARTETLFIIDDIIADKNLARIAVSGKHHNDYSWLFHSSIRPFRKTKEAKEELRKLKTYLFGTKKKLKILRWYIMKRTADKWWTIHCLGLSKNVKACVFLHT